MRGNQDPRIGARSVMCPYCGACLGGPAATLHLADLRRLVYHLADAHPWETRLLLLPIDPILGGAP